MSASAASGVSVGFDPERSAAIQVIGTLAARGEHGNTEWMSVEFSVTGRGLEGVDCEVEGRLWSPLHGSWLPTWDIRHAAADGTAVRRVALGTLDEGSPMRIEVAIPSWAVICPGEPACHELVWDLRIFDASGVCVGTGQSRPFVAPLTVGSQSAAPLAQVQLTAALAVATASSDGPLNDEERTAIRIVCLEELGGCLEARRSALDVVDCLAHEPIAAWEYLESFLAAIRPDSTRVEALLESAVRVATADGPVGVEESILLNELRRRLEEQQLADAPTGRYHVDLDTLHVQGPEPLAGGQTTAANTDSVSASSLGINQDVDIMAIDSPKAPAFVPLPESAEPDSAAVPAELSALFDELTGILAREAGFGEGEHRPRPETLVSLLEETGTISRDMALEVRFVVNLCARAACGEDVSSSKTQAALQIGREIINQLA